MEHGTLVQCWWVVWGWEAYVYYKTSVTKLEAVGAKWTQTKYIHK